ncbi:MAG TPA: replication-relaxation family protein [Mycobacteriales bacterium]|nr:replication-relaxation family protein [Mycobacteriales bacterium]
MTAAGRVGAGRQPLRVRMAHVEWVAERLSTRDQAILASVERLRLVSGAQLERLHFHELSSPSRARTRRRVLARLAAWRVLLSLERRIGGVRAGSSGLVFTLDTTGLRLAQLAAHLRGTASARRPAEPSAALLRHTLAVTELYVSLAELSRTGGFQLSDYQTEPSCWHPTGYGGWLKPDAYLTLSTNQFDDYWWIEADQGTEHLPTIRRKLSVYLDHLNTGGSGPGGITPRVLVMVPAEARRSAIAEVIRHLPEPTGKLLHVVTEDHAPKYLLQALRE